jgi:hypothetical protein
LELAVAVLVSACEAPRQQNALGGGAPVGGTGALVGSPVSGGSADAATLGATSSAMIGAAATPQPTYAGGPAPRGCARWANDYNGNRICTAFY